MDAFLVTFAATFLLALGARDQLIVAQFSDAVGRTGPMLVLGMAVAAASAAAAAYAGWSVAALLPAGAVHLLACLALVLAAIDLALPVHLRSMKEPTRSYVAIAAVLFVRQVMGAARIVIFALALMAIHLWPHAAGGALGGAAAIGLGWYWGKDSFDRAPLLWMRRIMAACLIVAAFLIGSNARFAGL
ncbi:hypothetical protein [Erythrobacter ani]|uniref:Uncharacterized protein n=1 Tax=Erythrobacter ani TaxID=2827235 RepID=A0ABS6SM81_9SPHN|nr:hypothetical protein [Erythrobacter ani]MBV7266141.1 hypothetical protein [Erythrobacter ani]